MDEYFDDPDDVARGTTKNREMLKKDKAAMNTLYKTGINKADCFEYDGEVFAEAYPEIVSALSPVNRMYSTEEMATRLALQPGRMAKRYRPLIIERATYNRAADNQTMAWAAACASVEYGYDVKWIELYELMDAFMNPHCVDWKYDWMRNLQHHTAMYFFNDIAVRHNTPPWAYDDTVKRSLHAFFCALHLRGANTCFITDADAGAWKWKDSWADIGTQWQEDGQVVLLGECDV